MLSALQGSFSDIEIPKWGFYWAAEHTQDQFLQYLSGGSFRSSIVFFTTLFFELVLTGGQEVGGISYRKVSLHKHKYSPREMWR